MSKVLPKFRTLSTSKSCPTTDILCVASKTTLACLIPIRHKTLFDGEIRSLCCHGNSISPHCRATVPDCEDGPFARTRFGLTVVTSITIHSGTDASIRISRADFSRCQTVGPTPLLGLLEIQHSGTDAFTRISRDLTQWNRRLYSNYSRSHTVGPTPLFGFLEIQHSGTDAFTKISRDPTRWD